MDYVRSIKDIENNIKTLERYLKSKHLEEKEFAKSLISRGKCLIVYSFRDENHFAPSRFIGYKENNMKLHLANETKDGMSTTPEISKVLKEFYKLNYIPLAFDNNCENNYKDYCDHLNVKLYNYKRKYWKIPLIL